MLKITQATTMWQRMKGLLGKREQSSDEALLIRPCKQVHTFFMRFPIDVVFLQDQKVIHIQTLKPWRISTYNKQATAVLELNAGQAERHGLIVGSDISI